MYCIQGPHKTNMIAKENNLNWHHQSCSVTYIVEYCSQMSTRKPHKIKPRTLPFPMYGKGAFLGSNQWQLYWTVKEESSKMTWVQNWKKQFNKNWAPPSWDHCYDATIQPLPTWCSHPHTAVLDVPSSCCCPHTATKTSLLHIKWWATKMRSELILFQFSWKKRHTE